MKTDITVQNIELFKVRARCRTPLSFGAVVIEEIPIGYARATVENRAGQVADGWGAMFLMDLWPWPVSEASHETKQTVMRELLDAYARLIADRRDFGHPIEIFMESEDDLRKANREICRELTPGEEMPFLGALVTASSVDHAIHDAFGNVNGIDSYHGYGPDHMSFDLSRYLGEDFAGVYPSQFLRQDYLPAIPIFHLVGGVDFLTKGEVKGDLPDDGVPNSLDEWIEHDGVFCLKVKLRGRDLEWDLARTRAVRRVYRDVRNRTKRALPDRPVLSVDFNEQCQTADYVVEYLQRLREDEPLAFEDLLYVEQPVDRDLEKHDMRPVSSLKPVLVDESLASIEDLRLAMKMGWSGIALKSCKCLSSDLLLLCAAELAGIPYAVQDLTNPSIALIESVGLAARIHTIKGVETNSRQFFPRANEIVAPAHPDLFHVRDGCARTSSLTGAGLGMQIEKVPGFLESLRAADAEFQETLR
ncbi:MAG TPA: enolase C-terminal domain-like protein [Armatimonadota bacterium]|nr:enolase C-terminal domain-like protein [Armatimonadota bacterium]